MMTQLRQRMLEELQRSLVSSRINVAVQPVLGSVRSLTETTSGFTSSVRLLRHGVSVLALICERFSSAGYTSQYN